MTLAASLTIANSGLAAIGQGFSVISHNIANADTQGYGAESTTQWTLYAEDLGEGVFAGPATLAKDPSLQAQLYQQNASAGAAQATSAALSALQPSLGSVGAGNDLGSLLANVQTQFSSLLNDPSSATAQGAVVSAAQALTGKINSLASAYGQARQNAQDALVSGVGSLNAALSDIGTLSDRIIMLKSQGASTADLENERNQDAATISGLVGVRFSELPNGDLQVFTTNGTQLPTRGATRLSVASAQAGSGAYYPGGGLPGITLDGADVTSQLGGGSIGAELALRDTTLPTYGAALDEFAQTLSSRFAAQGLALFSDPQGNVPAGGGTPVQSGYVGYASAITVNPAVVNNPALVRDGTNAVPASTTGASAFTPNPSGQTGFSVLIQRVLNFALGAQAQDGVAQPPAAASGLGPSGTLSAPFTGAGNLGDYATALTASQAADSATATTAATDQADTQSALSNQLQTQTGVNMDGQLSLMVQLQNAYGANAKIISAVQEMFTTLLQAVQG